LTRGLTTCKYSTRIAAKFRKRPEKFPNCLFDHVDELARFWGAAQRISNIWDFMSATHDYASELRADLPIQAFRPVLSRLIWLPIHLVVIGVAVCAILFGELGWVSKTFLSLIIGHSFAVLAFLAHEILHGTVVRQRWIQSLTGGICLLPHCLPPDVWRTWHNRFHHGYTGVVGKDPDGFGDPVLYRRSKFLYTILTFLPGSGYLRSAFYFLFYFTFHVLFVLFLHSRKYEYWTQQKRKRQLKLFFCEVCFWVTVAAVVGLQSFLFIYVLPLMIANTIQMMYVTTNHWLCDGEDHDHHADPLKNSLSVKMPRMIDWLHLNTSYHTEHHLGPAINPRHAPLINDSMVARHGSRCRRLSLFQIMVMTYRTPRIRLSENELVDINNGKVYSTLGPHGETPRFIDQVPVPVRRRRHGKEQEILPIPDQQPEVQQGSPAVESSNRKDVLPFPVMPEPAAKSRLPKVA
jgi:fatty acid desaturase